MRYREYKKVDIPWLDEVPSHWEMKNVNSLFDERREKVSDKDYPPLSVTKNGILPQLENVAKSMASDNRKKVLTGDFVINSRSDRKGSSGLSSYDGSVSLISTVIKPRLGFNKFWHYLLKSNDFIEEFYRNGKGIVADLWTTNFQSMKSIILPVPPKEEQEQIARFLDWKINEIDRLIGTYTNKISKLNDLKNVTISNYIFNGINNNTKFKKVGLSYIDQIPENWELEKIKFNFEIVKRIAGKEGYNVLSITQQGIVIKDISKNEGQMASDYSKYQFVEKGDFAMNHMDLLTGYIDISKFFGVTSPDYRVFRIMNKLKIYDKYYLLMFQYFYKSRIFYKLGQGASHLGRWRLPSDNFLNMKTPVPSYNEQVKIVDLINSKFKILNHQIERLKRIVYSLENLKQSLISDVVTGKIDVRNISIPEYDKVSDIEDDVILEESFNEEV